MNIIKRIMWTLGTEGNPEPFVNIKSSFNGRKMSVSAVTSVAMPAPVQFVADKFDQMIGHALT